MHARAVHKGGRESLHVLEVVSERMVLHEML
jgi:hypothetical protein